MNTTIPDIPTKNKKTLLSGKELAEILDVSAPTLSEATKKGYNCAGYPVSEWAEISESGRVQGYDVPGFLLLEHQEKLKKRPNPEPEEPNKANLAPNKGENVEYAQNSEVTNHYSLLPKGENIVNPVGMVSLPLVLTKALEHDTPQSRAVIGGTLALLGAITAHSIAESGIAAGVGAGAGLGIAVYFYRNFNNSGNNQKFIISDWQTSPEKFEKPIIKPQMNSGYVV